jgi:L-asparaginase
MKLRLLATGGTIASRRDPGTGAVVPAVSPDDLLAAVPGLDDVAEVEVTEIDRVNGWNVTPEVMVRTAHAARRALHDDGVDGIVVTHGTDTTEETLYLVDLLAGDATDAGAIVVACAMRSAGEVGADGPRNLLDAARVAVDPAARGRGALLCVNDEIHCARWVTKTDTTNISTFRSWPGGPVGHLELGAPRFVLPTPPRPPAGDDIDTNVALVKAYTGMDDVLVRWLVDERDIHGLVVEGTGAGNVPGTLVPGIDHAIARGIPVVIASRCVRGRPQPVYGGPGGGVTLAEHGVIRSNGLNAAKARLALMVALGRDRDPDRVRAWFADA